MAATLPVANFDINTLNLWFLNGVSNTQSDKDIFTNLAGVSGLSTAALLKIGKHANEAPAGLFTSLGTLNGQPVTDVASYMKALTAPPTGNAANLQCERIFDAHALRQIYSSVLVQAYAGSFLDDAMSLGMKTELESLVADVFNSSVEV